MTRTRSWRLSSRLSPEDAERLLACMTVLGEHPSPRALLGN